jgi:murein DD-endopeptidase MepM/ murein hydrolase activator NlpD
MYRFPAFVILIVLLVSSCDISTQQPKTTDHEKPVLLEKDPIVEEIAEPELNAFGIDESLDVSTHVIRRNESLSAILRAHGLTPAQIHELSRSSTGVFDVRRLRAGRPLHIFSETDSTGSGKITHVVYEDNSADFVRFHLADSMFVVRDSKSVEIRTRLVSGSITSSLYQTMREIGVNPQLTHRLADVYAWQVDFYRIQPGDHFRVLFEERLVDGEVSDLGRIKAAVFNHRNQDFYAFHYLQDDLDEYFDEEGNSLRRQFMAAPLDYTRISSRFTNRRFHPVLRRNMPHHGTDYAAPVGTPIRAVGDGTVTVARFDRNNGNYIRIRHNSIYETGYLHMSRFAEGMRPGTQVKQGQIIGYVGSNRPCNRSAPLFPFLAARQARRPATHRPATSRSHQG